MIDHGTFRDRLAGLLIGTAVGDAIGLPRESMAPERARRMFGDAPLRHRFFLGRGMVSDDSEHAFMAGTSLLKHPQDPKRFAASLGWRLRWWFAALPPGIGLGTAEACMKLWLGFSASKSGVRSAGNGPAMRAPIIGALLHDQPELLRQMTRASTCLTHTDPRTEEGAWLIAMAAAYAVRHAPGNIDANEFFDAIVPHLQGEQLKSYLAIVRELLARNAQPGELAERLSLRKGVTGYINYTVPAVLFCWFRYRGNFREIVEQTILLGGDADTTGAIAGALAGASLRRTAIPPEWIDGIWDWPLSVSKLVHLAERLADLEASSQKGATATMHLFWPARLLRNMLQLILVLLHGSRRLLPPY